MKKHLDTIARYYFLFKVAEFSRSVLQETCRKMVENKRKTSYSATPDAKWSDPRAAVILPSRAEAAKTIDSLVDRIKIHKFATVADFNELVDLKSSWSDSMYGWTSIPEAAITRVKDGYRLDLPVPKYIP